MASYTIKVPNHDDGHDLGEYEADYLPRVGDQLVLMHPRVSPGKHEPFVGTVSMVTHEAYLETVEGPEKGHVNTTVWIAEEAPAPQLYCDCTEEQRIEHGVDKDDDCENCGHKRRV